MLAIMYDLGCPRCFCQLINCQVRLTVYVFAEENKFILVSCKDGMYSWSKYCCHITWFVIIFWCNDDYEFLWFCTENCQNIILQMCLHAWPLLLQIFHSCLTLRMFTKLDLAMLLYQHCCEFPCLYRVISNTQLIKYFFHKFRDGRARLRTGLG